MDKILLLVPTVLTVISGVTCVIKCIQAFKSNKDDIAKTISEYKDTVKKLNDGEAVTQTQIQEVIKENRELKAQLNICMARMNGIAISKTNVDTKAR